MKRQGVNEGFGIQRVPPSPFRVDLDDDVGRHDGEVHEDEAEGPLSRHDVAVERDGDEGAAEDEEEASTAHKEGRRHLDKHRLPRLAREIGSRDPDSEEDVQHRTSEACAQRHQRIAHSCDGNVGDEITKRVALDVGGSRRGGWRGISYVNKGLLSIPHIVDALPSQKSSSRGLHR